MESFDKKLNDIVTESIKKVLKENYEDFNKDSITRDKETLKKIYMKALEIEEIAEKNYFGNSPVMEHTEAIMKYCIEQKIRLTKSQHNVDDVRI